MVAGMLQIHRASRGDTLAAGLADMLRRPAGDPFAPEVVSVPTRGVERWLSQQLSGVLGARPGYGDGVCANVAFPFPATVVGAALAAATGVRPDADPWLPERSVWPLLAVVDEAVGEPWLSSLAAHLGAGEASGGFDEERRDRRFSMVRHLADLFDRYGVHRPAMVRAWAGGARRERAEEAWQAELWRRLRHRIGLASPAERLGPACERLAVEPYLVELPQRFSLFGLTRLPASYVDVLVALAASREVHLWLLHPSPSLWEKVAATGAGRGRRQADPTAALPRNPLLRTWGRDAREMQLVLGADQPAGEAMPDPQPEHTLLSRIQADVRADREPPSPPFPGSDDPRAPLTADDRSLQVHSCHGRARQVEVLRDAIVHLLAEDPTLEPRDVIVMCPDIEAFAPLVHASFGPGREVRGADLHVRLADRSLRQTNPLLDALSRLLDMAAGRATASDLLDLAGTVAVRVRFGFDDDELARLDGWVRTAGVRWGTDAAWRAPYRLGTLEHGTWTAGLDRLLTGVAMSEDPLALVGGVLPLDDVGSGDIDLAGRFAELVGRARSVLRSFASPRTLGSWVDAITVASDTLLGAAPEDEWQRAQLRSLLDDVLAHAAAIAGGAATELRPAEVRALLADRLRGVPTRANFRTGHLTVCTLVPMRSVPHRVICLLGLDDGAFPRASAPDGDDLLEAEPFVGDRDPRSEDRQLLLDALLAARQALIVTYSGHDERTNALRPPSVPVEELLDLVDRTVCVDHGSARERVVVEHPLQPYDERNFLPGQLLPDRPWSFDRGALDGALASRRRRAPPRPVFAEVLSAIRPEPVVLDDVLSFLAHPVRAFLRQRLGVGVHSEGPGPRDAIAVELDALEQWQVGERLLRACLAGADLRDVVRAELARGSLPPGQLGARALDELVPRVSALVEASSVPVRHPRLVDVAAPLSGGLTVAGTVGDVFGDEVRTVTYSRLGAKKRLGAWAQVLALSVAAPERPWQARSVGRALAGNGVAVARVGPLGSDPATRAALAAAALDVLVDLYLRGMREPLPLACKTSMAWATAARAGKDPDVVARGSWVSRGRSAGEDADPAHQLVYGGRLAWDRLVAFEPAEGEDGEGWSNHPARAARLAVRLCGGLLAVEDLR